MFDLLKNAWARRQEAVLHMESLTRWADDNGLQYSPLPNGGWAVHGDWGGQPVRIECAAPSRPFIQGAELMARVDLGRATAGGVVVMNRMLKHHLEHWASELYSQYTDTLQTTAQQVPDEVRWLSMYRDAGWSGPDRHFWSRYAVLTNVLDVAREWIDGEGLQRLMRWPVDALSPDTPLMLMLLKGKAYMRLQLDDGLDTDKAMHALDLFRHFGEQALELPETV